MTALNGKILLLTMLISGGIAAILGITQIWFHFLEWEIFIKSLATILIIGCLSGFLMAIDYDFPASPQKKVLTIMMILILIMGLILLIQMWWMIMTWSAFAKIFGTILILFLLVSFIVAIKEDFGSSKKLKDDHYLD